VSSAAPEASAAAAAAALPIRQVDAFTDVIGFASASLTAVLFQRIISIAKCNQMFYKS